MICKSSVINLSERYSPIRLIGAVNHRCPVAACAACVPQHHTIGGGAAIVNSYAMSTSARSIICNFKRWRSQRTGHCVASFQYVVAVAVTIISYSSAKTYSPVSRSIYRCRPRASNVTSKSYCICTSCSPLISIGMIICMKYRIPRTPRTRYFISKRRSSI